MATQARVALKIPARIVGGGNITATLVNGVYIISDDPGVSIVSTVAELPNPAATPGARRCVTDSVSDVFGTIVGGGGVIFVPVYSDGTQWKVG